MLMATNELPRIVGFDQPTELAAPVTAWCMILVRPSLEQEARDFMRRQGVGVYWPNYAKWTFVVDRRGHRGMRSATVALFPGVLFSPAKFTSHFWNVMDLAPGVMNIARKHGGELVILDDLDIVIVHKIEEGLNKAPPVKPVHNFKTGDKVRLMDDDLSRWGVAKVSRLLKDGRISVDVPLMGRMTAVVVLPHQIGRV